ncbi:DsbA family protein [Actinacidiphila oryziradicis]|uniref:Disulfide bond formation protein DsbA n=1 Tax=Actinacidiphila oryziradicis TaxID=2571141 RepID=A0A4U0T8P3_9ACTN|nr:thioredoxin domain-containing protein [Actinacidiphila oryziradicis]TKA11255.1 disulfide bond formation protein DsbA [Actinacidiphila oryziradicis]
MPVRTAGRAVAVAATATLLTLSVTACGALTTSSNSAASASPSSSAASATAVDPAVLAALPARLEADGTTITVGDPAVKNVIHVYEDPRCPICKRFEAAAAGQLATLAKAGKIKIQYTLASFLDQNLHGNGSKKAANALRAALEQGKFPSYHAVLYENQPEETVDGFNDASLLKLAGTVGGLRGTAFDTAVKTQKYGDFVTKSEQAFVTSGASGTPTVKINGKLLESADLQKLFESTTFAALLKAKGIG